MQVYGIVIFLFLLTLCSPNWKWIMEDSRALIFQHDSHLESTLSHALLAKYCADTMAYTKPKFLKHAIVVQGYGIISCVGGNP